MKKKESNSYEFPKLKNKIQEQNKKGEEEVIKNGREGEWRGCGEVIKEGKPEELLAKVWWLLEDEKNWKKWEKTC